jgi:hypothetical protein
MAEYRDDIESDLSVFHRVDDVDRLTITRLLALAPRLSAYAGALRARYAEGASNAPEPSKPSVRTYCSAN